MDIPAAMIGFLGFVGVFLGLGSLVLLSGAWLRGGHKAKGCRECPRAGDSTDPTRTVEP